MASGHRKRKAALVRQYVLNPISASNVPASEAGITADQNNLVNMAAYSSGGYAPSFTQGQGILSDSISNSDSLWTLAGLTGETTNAGAFASGSLSGAVGILSTVKHYWMPKPGTVQLDLSTSAGSVPTGSVIIYTGDGPQSSYVPYYLGETTATGSIKFGAQITGTGTPTHLAVYIAGKLGPNDLVAVIGNSDSMPLQARFATGSNTTFSDLTNGVTTASATDLVASSLYRKAFLIPTGNISTSRGITVILSSSAKVSTTPVAGAFVVISSGSYGTVP